MEGERRRSRDSRSIQDWSSEPMEPARMEISVGFRWRRRRNDWNGGKRGFLGEGEERRDLRRKRREERVERWGSPERRSSEPFWRTRRAFMEGESQPPPAESSSALCSTSFEAFFKASRASRTAMDRLIEKRRRVRHDSELLLSS
ncbi:putative basic proline-rich protein-like [Iris pallida]|uniref:Basic proline-rich protein-like n=1 Tax=Iris pallida TaxID=29817 RepID=A0AAX6GR95_IRIPA|nr:putative basic proline-rich protein-like [Iris pallida]